MYVYIHTYLLTYLLTYITLHYITLHYIHTSISTQISFRSPGFPLEHMREKKNEAGCSACELVRRLRIVIFPFPASLRSITREKKTEKQNKRTAQKVTWEFREKPSRWQKLWKAAPSPRGSWRASNSSIFPHMVSVSQSRPKQGVSQRQPARLFDELNQNRAKLIDKFYKYHKIWDLVKN